MESISRISGLFEQARDLTLDASRAIPSRVPRLLPVSQLRKLLSSTSQRDITYALRQCVTLSYLHPGSPDCVALLPHVLKNIATPSRTTRRLIYTYLIRHAEDAPDTALLAVNSIQKALSDNDPTMRALALRVMSSLRVPVIAQIVSLAIKKGCTDPSPLVRRAAAQAIPKCYRLDPGTLPQLREYISQLLADRQYYVCGSAVEAYAQVCKGDYSMLHPVYRSLVRKLVDMDEWGQIALLSVMVPYARSCFPRRVKRVPKKYSSTKSDKHDIKGFYDDDDADAGTQSQGQQLEDIIDLDPDLELLLNAAKSLLSSRNAAVVVAVARLYLYLGTSTYLSRSVGPLIALLRSSEDVRHIALYNIVQVCLVTPAEFVRYTSHFLLRSTDAPNVREMKLEVLTLVFPHAPTHLQGLILQELEAFSQGADAELVRQSVRAIGRCAQASDEATAERCLRLLLKQISSADSQLVAEALEVIRHLIQRRPDAHASTVVQLAKSLDTASNPQARASIIWLVGEFAGVQPEGNIAADVLRILVKGFADESEFAKLQIVLLAAKVYVHHLNANNSSSANSGEAVTSPESDNAGMDAEASAQADSATMEPEDTITVLWRYVLLLARYDVSYDLRDRTRMFKALLADPKSTQLATLVLLAPKPIPQMPSPSESRKHYTLGTATLVVADESGEYGLRNYEPVPDWVQDGHQPSSAVRNEIGQETSDSKREQPINEQLGKGLSTAAVSTSAVGPKAKEKTLDDWLDEDDQAEESEYTDETDEDASSETESEEEDDEDEKLLE